MEPTQHRLGKIVELFGKLKFPNSSSGYYIIFLTERNKNTMLVAPFISAETFPKNPLRESF